MKARLRLPLGLLCAALLVTAAACSHTPGLKEINERAAGGVELETADVGRAIDSVQVKITDTTHDFYNNETVFAVVGTDNKTSNPATLEVRWNMGGQSIGDESVSLPPGESKHQFRMANGGAMTNGDYTLEIRVNGTLLRTLKFSVKNR